MEKFFFLLILITLGVLQFGRSLPRKDGTFNTLGKRIAKIEGNKYAYYMQWFHTLFLMLVIGYLIFRVLTSE